jgi:hypothetical protein
VKNEALYPRDRVTLNSHCATIEDLYLVQTERYPQILPRFHAIVPQYFKWIAPKLRTQIVPQFQIKCHNLADSSIPILSQISQINACFQETKHDHQIQYKKKIIGSLTNTYNK